MLPHEDDYESDEAGDGTEAIAVAMAVAVPAATTARLSSGNDGCGISRGNSISGSSLFDIAMEPATAVTGSLTAVN